MINLSEEFKNFENNLEEIAVLIGSLKYFKYAKIDIEGDPEDTGIEGDPKDFFKNKSKKLVDTILKSEIVLLNSYFEAYCKKKFVKILNKNRKLAIDYLKNKSKISKDLKKVDLIYLGKYEFNIKDKMGDIFIDRQIVNFQDPQKYEQIFSDFFNITFFENDEQKEHFKKFSAIRNCIVHSANIPDEKYKMIVREDKSPTEVLSQKVIHTKGTHTSFELYSDVLLKLIRDIVKNIEEQSYKIFVIKEDTAANGCIGLQSECGLSGAR